MTAPAEASYGQGLGASKSLMGALQLLSASLSPDLKHHGKLNLPPWDARLGKKLEEFVRELACGLEEVFAASAKSCGDRQLSDGQCMCCKMDIPHWAYP